MPDATSTRPTAAAADQLLSPKEAAALFRVDPKTLTRWAKAGKVRSLKTAGGHRRYRTSELVEDVRRAADQSGSARA